MKKVREKLNAKLRKSGGFTLVEMLIVVAIIAILIAVSIPLVSGSLEKAREATDDANMRTAAAVANIIYLSSGETDDIDGKYYKVDMTNGSQGSLIDGTTDAYEAKASIHSAAKYIKVTWDTTAGEIKVAWSNGN